MTDGQFFYRRNQMNKNTNTVIGILTAVIFLVIYNVSSFAYQCSEVRSDTIRLHVIASSDSEADQALKLKVRDAVLEQSSDLFDGSVTTENATERIIPQINNIKKIADKVLKDNNANYKAEVTLLTEYFDTRIYENGITMPAGKYLALKIILGNGEGKNWWCVMFPALCLPAAETEKDTAIETVYTNGEKSVIMNTNKYEIRFRIIEYIEKIKNMVDN